MKKIVILFLIIAAIWHLSTDKNYQLFGEIVSHAKNSENNNWQGEQHIALTFNDGSSATKNSGLLRILAINRVDATFFLVGREMEKNPSIVPLLVRDGHQVGNHTYTHDRMWFKNSDSVVMEIERTNARIRAGGFTGEIYFRAPHGIKLYSLPRYLDQQGIVTVTSDIDPLAELGDNASSDEIADYVVDHAVHGSIIEFSLQAESRAQVVAAMPKIVKRLKRMNYKFVTVDKLLNES